MLGQHCLANQKPTGLKFLVYTAFGHTGYDDDVGAYLKATTAEENKYGANAINQIHLAPVDKLLLYNALDSLYTYKLAELQKGRLSEFQHQGLAFFIQSAQTLAIAQINGFPLDVEILESVERSLVEQMAVQEKVIMDDAVLKQWAEGVFNFQSGPQLSRLLYQVLGITPKAFTASGKPSVDEETLSTINVPIVKNILSYRKLAKMRKTYIAQYAVETVNGRVHPYFNINGVNTFRSSSSGPNIQNQPKRDEEAKRLIRSFIRPSTGNRLVEFDYKSLEVVINCCYSNDPTLREYLTNPLSDMHRDSAVDCFMLKPEEVTKAIRNDVKGQFVFAEMYGSYYAQVAADLWETAEKHGLRKHLQDKGVRNYADFERHIEEAERILWEERFPVHNEWRDKQWKFYQKHGYVELLTGFRAYGPMKRNNTFNTPVQGAGYHVLQWTMNHVNKKVQRLERSYLIGEIHDSCVGDIHPSESDLVDYWYWLYGTQKVREHWDWITVPLTVEKEQSAIDGSWAEMKEVGPLKGE
jgi:DNA polymerase I-like protein with 3'-5' exonuclease and polymerase domains